MPRGHSSISDAVDSELQVRRTERDDVIELTFTKFRQSKGAVKRGWKRDFYYDEDAFTITPLNEDDTSKQALIERIRKVKEAHNLSNYALGNEIGVNEANVRRWLSGQYLPSEVVIPRILAMLVKLEDGATVMRQSCDASATVSASVHSKKTSHQEDDVPP